MVANQSGRASLREKHVWADALLGLAADLGCMYGGIAWGSPDTMAPIQGDRTSWDSERDREDSISMGKTLVAFTCPVGAVLLASMIYGQHARPPGSDDGSGDAIMGGAAAFASGYAAAGASPAPPRQPRQRARPTVVAEDDWEEPADDTSPPPRREIPPARTRSTTSTKLLVFGGRSHDKFLGCICGDYDSDSATNTYGTHGSKYSTDSIWNHYGDYGSAYSDTSACNEYASYPPVVVTESGDFVGYLTMNRYMSGAISDPDVARWLQSVCASD